MRYIHTQTLSHPLEGRKEEERVSLRPETPLGSKVNSVSSSELVFHDSENVTPARVSGKCVCAQ